MQKVNEICECCRERREDKHLQVFKLAAADGRTTHKNHSVPLCPHCDGDAILISQMGNHIDPEPV